jgi:phage baseplate assembly protein gpV
VSRISGVTIGLVKSLDDPEGLGRVQLTFPWMSEDEPESNWARIAVPMAGADRGMQFMPEVGDEVLVAFEQGEIRLPYVLGSLWNGEDKPPRDDPKLRTIKTVSGHVLEFDDTEGSEKITLITQGEHKLILNDTEGTVVLESKGGNVIRMADTPPGVSISLSTGSEVSLGPAGLSIDASTAMVDIKCLQATVNASALLSVTAPFVTFSGVVQTTTLIATSVVSTSYTPGAGNLI